MPSIETDPLVGVDLDEKVQPNIEHICRQKRIRVFVALIVLFGVYVLEDMMLSQSYITFRQFISGRPGLGIICGTAYFRLSFGNQEFIYLNRKKRLFE
jgi:hypothetical protein